MLFGFDPTFWHWLALALLFLAIEIVAPSTFFLWLSLAAGASTVVKLIFPDLNLMTQLALFSVFCVASLIAWWKFGITGREVVTDQPGLNERSQRYVGRVVKLSQAIENGIGKVTVEDSQWRVTGPDMAVGSMVRLVELDGATFRVEAA